MKTNQWARRERKKDRNTHLHRCGPPGGGGPHAILRSRQNKQAMIGFFFSDSLPSPPSSPSDMFN